MKPLVLSFVAVCALCVAPASAADPVAESMFQQALAQMKDGDFAAACPKLEASQKLEPRSGTLVMLGSCSEQLGKTATAWAQYLEAAGLARQEGRDKHAQTATELARALEAKLSRLRLDAPEDASLTVALGDRSVPLGVAFAVDPGTHVVTATAPGRLPWSTTVEIGPKADTRIVAIPALELEPVPEPSPPPAPVVAPARASAPAPEPPAPPPGESSRVPVWAWVSGGLGIAVAGLSVGFLVDSLAAGSELDEQCGGSARDQCSPSLDFDGLHTREKRSFVLFGSLGAAALLGIGAGIVGAAVGEASSTPEAGARLAPWVGVTSGGVEVIGTF